MKKVSSQFLKLQPFLFFIFLLFAFSSCSRYYYSPDDNNMQAIHEKGDVHLSGSTSLSRFRFQTEKWHYNFQVGGSPIKHLSLVGSFFYLRDTIRNGNGFTISTDDVGTGEGHIWNGAIGTYYFFSKEKNSLFSKSKKSKFTSKNKMQAGHFFDFYIGYSTGISNNYHDGWRVSDLSRLKFTKTYGQVGWHWKNEILGFSNTFKLSQLNFYSAKSFGKVDQVALDKLNELERQNKFYIRENSIRIHFGNKYGRIFYNWNFLLAPQSLQKLGIDTNNFQIGAFIEIDEFFRKRKEESNL